MKKAIETILQESMDVKRKLMADECLVQNIQHMVEDIANCLKTGGKLVLCGNGGSASDALHFSGEIVGRFMLERNPWPAVVLNSDVATMTSIANDYGYDEVFARQADAMLQDKDILIGISTSGNSENVLRAVNVAASKGIKTVALLGKNGGRIAGVADCSVIVPSDVTARIQECHITIIHIICELVEKRLVEESV